jgi:hypothetical protein
MSGTLASQALVAGASSPTAGVIVSEFPLNNHECFRAVVTVRDGKPIVSLSRWRSTATGDRRTGQSLEFGGHRVSAVVRLLEDVADALIQSGPRGMSCDGWSIRHLGAIGREADGCLSPAHSH